MWPFKKKSDGDFSLPAQTAATALLDTTEQAAPNLLKALVGEGGVKQELLVPLTLELLIFGLHLTDRIAFDRLGADNRAGFMNSLLPTVQRELQPPVSTHLQALYNTRNPFYGGFRKLYPEQQETLKGTLFWEFGKALGSIYADGNPAAITETSMFGMTFMQAINQAFESGGVFP